MNSNQDSRHGSQQGRFSIQQLLFWQFVIAPVFLAPAYADYNSRAHEFDPIRSLIWFLVVPSLYVFVLVIRRLRRKPPSSLVFAAIKSGVFFGLLFLILSFGPFGIPKLVQAFQAFAQASKSVSSPISPMMLACARETLGVPLMITGFAAINYVVLGAAVGAITSIAYSPFVKRLATDDVATMAIGIPRES